MFIITSDAKDNLYYLVSEEGTSAVYEDTVDEIKEADKDKLRFGLRTIANEE